MGRSSIMLLLTLAVLLQPAFASVCMMDCPPQVAAHLAQPMAGHAAHAHHHGMTTATTHALVMSSNGICDKTVDLRSSALISPTVSPAAMTSDLVILGTASRAVLYQSYVIERFDRFSPPIVIPLRI
jgi:hypothetical protein